MGPYKLVTGTTENRGPYGCQCVRVQITINLGVFMASRYNRFRRIQVAVLSLLRETSLHHANDVYERQYTPCNARNARTCTHGISKLVCTYMSLAPPASACT